MTLAALPDAFVAGRCDTTAPLKHLRKPGCPGPLKTAGAAASDRGSELAHCVGEETLTSEVSSPEQPFTDESRKEAHAMKLLASIKERRRNRAQRKLESAGTRAAYAHSREGRAAAEQGRRDRGGGDTSGIDGINGP
jgi:hypothetical protein